MNIAILSNQSDKYKSNKLIINVGKKRNHNVFVLNPKNLVMYLSDKEGQNRIYTNENGILEPLEPEKNKEIEKTFVGFWKIPSAAPNFGLRPNYLGDNVDKISYPGK